MVRHALAFLRHQVLLTLLCMHASKPAALNIQMWLNGRSLGEKPCLQCHKTLEDRNFLWSIQNKTYVEVMLTSACNAAERLNLWDLMLQLYWGAWVIFTKWPWLERYHFSVTPCSSAAVGKSHRGPPGFHLPLYTFWQHLIIAGWRTEPPGHQFRVRHSFSTLHSKAPQ